MTITRRTIILHPAVRGLLAAVASVALLFLGQSFYQKTTNLLDNGERAEAVVVDFVQKEKTDNKNKKETYYYPIFEFADPKTNQNYRVTAQVGSSKASYVRGEKIKVIYPPKTPEAAVIESWLELWFVPAVLLGLGGLCALAVVWMLLKAVILFGMWLLLRNKA